MTRTKVGWTVVGSDTDHTVLLHVAHVDVDEEEEAVQVASSLSSPFSPEKAYNQEPET